MLRRKLINNIQINFVSCYPSTPLSMISIKACVTTATAASTTSSKQVNPSSSSTNTNTTTTTTKTQFEESDPENTTARLRKDTDREFYEPGPIAKILRKVVVKTTQNLGLRQKVAARMEHGLKEVAKMEDESKWLRAHGSPLRVLGLPDSADLDDVKARYRNLLFEVHPDTAPREDKRALAKLGLNEDQIRSRQQTEFELLQTAFKIATNPASLWHQDGNAPALTRELQPNLTLFDQVFNAQTLFPFAAYIYGFAVLFVIFSIVAKYVLDAGLHFTDPKFYEFMYQQEKEERRKREAGEEVDYNPKRLAPMKFRKISAPGLFVNRFVPRDDDLWQDD